MALPIEATLKNKCESRYGSLLTYKMSCAFLFQVPINVFSSSSHCIFSQVTGYTVRKNKEQSILKIRVCDAYRHVGKTYPVCHELQIKLTAKL